MPSEIPQISFTHPKEENRENGQPELRLSALNLKELEGEPPVEFESVELEQPELESEKTRPVDRMDVLRSIEETALPEADVIDYVPINFDDLAADSYDSAEDDANDDRWTQVLNFNWKEVEIKED